MRKLNYRENKWIYSIVHQNSLASLLRVRSIAASGITAAKKTRPTLVSTRMTASGLLFSGILISIVWIQIIATIRRFLTAVVHLLNSNAGAVIENNALLGDYSLRSINRIEIDKRII